MQSFMKLAFSMKQENFFQCHFNNIVWIHVNSARKLALMVGDLQ